MLCVKHLAPGRELVMNIWIGLNLVTRYLMLRFLSSNQVGHFSNHISPRLHLKQVVRNKYYISKASLEILITLSMPSPSVHLHFYFLKSPPQNQSRSHLVRRFDYR